jgi:hypothetical protein
MSETLGLVIIGAGQRNRGILGIYAERGMTGLAG